MTPGGLPGVVSMPYSFVLPAALAFFQRSFAAAAILARAAALICRLAFFAGFTAALAPLPLAHLARAAAAIRARPAALILCFLAGPASTGLAAPRILASSLWSVAILSWILAALRNSRELRFTFNIESY